MAKKQYVPIHPATLAWARVEVGLSCEQVAEKTKWSVAEIKAWEAGSSGITMSDGRKLAQKYKVSLPFLYRRDTPKQHTFDNIKDFRNISRQDTLSSRLCVAIRDATHKQQWLRNFLIEEEHAPLQWLGAHSANSDATAIAEHIRDWLGIRVDDISALKNAKEALDYWVDKIEAKGVVVASNSTHGSHNIPREEYSGLVLYDEYAPLILLNPADSLPRRIFTLLHELAHLIIGRTSNMSLVDFKIDDGEYDATEVLCNTIASDVLISRDVVNECWNSALSVRENIDALQQKLHCSRSAIAVALKRYGSITQQQLRELLDFYREKYYEYANTAVPSGGRAYPDKQAIDRCGKLLTTRVLTAYEQGSINALEIYDVLGMKLKHLTALSERLRFPLHRWHCRANAQSILTVPCVPTPSAVA